MCSSASIASPSNPLFTCNVNPPVTLSISANGTVDSVQWFNNGTYFLTAPTVNVNKWSIGEITAIAYCNNNAISSTNSVVVNRLDLTSGGGPTSICFGQAVTVTAPAVPGANYEWFHGGPVTPGTGVASGSSNTHLTNYVGNIFCQITPPNGCRKFAKLRITEPKNCPEFSVSAPEDPYFLCQAGNPKGLLFVGTNGANFDSIQWFRTDVTPVQYQGSKMYPDSTWDVDRWSVGVYSATLWYLGVTQNSAGVNVNRFDITSVGGGETACPSQPITLKAPYLHTPVNYEWFEGGTVVPGTGVQSGTDSSFTTSFIGNVFCQITHDGCSKFAKFRVYEGTNCTGSKEAKKSSISGTDNLSVGLESDLFPNPSNGNFSLMLSGLVAGENIQVELMDINGRVVHSVNYQANDSIEKLDINKNLPTGFYAVRVHHMGAVVVNRAIVH